MPAEPLTVLYVAGTGRSGSTLLDLMLGSIPGVLSLGEFWRVWAMMCEDDRYCGCGSGLKACAFWGEAVQRAFGGFEDVPASRYRAVETPLKARRQLPRFAVPALLGRRRPGFVEAMAAREQLYRAAANAAGARMVVDSSKQVNYLHALRHAPGLRLRVVHLVRDSRAVAFSWDRVKSNPRPRDPSNTLKRFPPVTSSVMWDLEQAEVELFVRPLLPTLRVYYEELCRAPANVVRRIMRFAGHEQLGKQFSLDAVGAAPNHTVGGNPLRLQPGPLTVQPDDEWRTTMPPSARKTTTRLTWPLLALYGYVPPWSRRYAR